MIKFSVRFFSNAPSKHSKFQIGDRAHIIKKITKKDVDEFMKLSGDTNRIHIGSERERAVVHGAFLNSLVSSVIGTKLPGPGTLVIKQTLNFPNKCFIDEEVKVSVELVEVRKIITVRFSCDVNDKAVLYGDAKLIIDK